MKLTKTLLNIALLSAISAPIASQAEGVSLNGWASTFATAYANQQSIQGQAEGKGQIQIGRMAAAPASTQSPSKTPGSDMPASAAKSDQPAADKPSTETPANAPEQKAAAPSESKKATPKDAPATKGGQVTGEGSLTGNAGPLSAAGKVAGSAGVNFTTPASNGGKEVVLNQVDSAYTKAGQAADTAAAKGVDTLNQLTSKVPNGGNMSVEGSGSGSLNVANIATANATGNLSVNGALAGASQISSLSAAASSVLMNVIASRPASITSMLR